MKAELVLFSKNIIDDEFICLNLNYIYKKINKRNEIIYILNSISDESLYTEEIIIKCISLFFGKESQLKKLLQFTNSTIEIQIIIELSSKALNPSFNVSNEIIEFCHLCGATIDYDIYVNYNN